MPESTERRSADRQWAGITQSINGQAIPIAQRYGLSLAEAATVAEKARDLVRNYFTGKEVVRLSARDVPRNGADPSAPYQVKPLGDVVPPLSVLVSMWKTSSSCRELSDQCWTAFGRTRVRMKLARCKRAREAEDGQRWP